MLGACLAWGDVSLSGGRRPQPPGPGEGGALWLSASEGTQEKRSQGRLPLVWSVLVHLRVKDRGWQGSCYPVLVPPPQPALSFREGKLLGLE